MASIRKSSEQKNKNKDISLLPLFLRSFPPSLHPSSFPLIFMATGHDLIRTAEL